jgi:hypothetical protein
MICAFFCEFASSSTTPTGQIQQIETSRTNPDYVIWQIFCEELHAQSILA